LLPSRLFVQLALEAPLGQLVMTAPRSQRIPWGIDSLPQIRRSHTAVPISPRAHRDGFINLATLQRYLVPELSMQITSRRAALACRALTTSPLPSRPPAPRARQPAIPRLRSCSQALSLPAAGDGDACFARLVERSVCCRMMCGGSTWLQSVHRSRTASSTPCK